MPWFVTATTMLSDKNKELCNKLEGLKTENKELKKKLFKIESLFHAAMIGQSNYMAENEKLKKKLEPPSLKWKKGAAFIGDACFGYIEEDNNNWNAINGKAEMILQNAPKKDAIAAVEKDWVKFWNQIYGVKK